MTNLDPTTSHLLAFVLGVVICICALWLTTWVDIRRARSLEREEEATTGTSNPGSITVTITADTTRFEAEIQRARDAMPAWTMRTREALGDDDQDDDTTTDDDGEPCYDDDDRWVDCGREDCPRCTGIRRALAHGGESASVEEESPSLIETTALCDPEPTYVHGGGPWRDCGQHPCLTCDPRRVDGDVGIPRQRLDGGLDSDGDDAGPAGPAIGDGRYVDTDAEPEEPER